MGMNDSVHQREHNYCNRIMGGLTLPLHMHHASHVHNSNEAVQRIIRDVDV